MNGRSIRNWLKAACLRAVRTAAQTAIATVGTTAVLGEVNWRIVASSAGLSAALSVLGSIAALPRCKDCGEYNERS